MDEELRKYLEEEYPKGSLGYALGGMLSFLDTLTTPESPEEARARIVGRYEENGVFVSTVRSRDRGTYETGVVHPEYSEKIIIVEDYGTDREAAVKGHDRWVKLMTSDDLPEFLQTVDHWGLGFPPCYRTKS